jgi:hypothetical protein
MGIRRCITQGMQYCGRRAKGVFRRVALRLSTLPRRTPRAVLQKRPCPHPLRRGRLRLPVATIARQFDVPGFTIAPCVVSRARGCTELHRRRGTEGSNPTPSTSESMANSLPHPAPTAPVLFVCDPGAFAPYLRDRMTVAVSQRIRAATRSEGCTATDYAVNRRLTLSPLRFGAMRLEQHRDWRIPGIDRHPIVALLFRKTLCGPNT